MVIGNFFLSFERRDDPLPFPESLWQDVSLKAFSLSGDRECACPFFFSPSLSPVNHHALFFFLPSTFFFHSFDASFVVDFPPLFVSQMN